MYANLLPEGIRVPLKLYTVGIRNVLGQKNQKDYFRFSIRVSGKIKEVSKDDKVDKHDLDGQYEELIGNNNKKKKEEEKKKREEEEKKRGSDKSLARTDSYYNPFAKPDNQKSKENDGKFNQTIMTKYTSYHRDDLVKLDKKKLNS